MGATSHSRRSVLQTLAIGAGASALSGLGPSAFAPLERRAYAADGSPKRLLVIMDPHGISELQGWASFAKRGGAADPAKRNGSGGEQRSPAVDTQFTLLGMTTPLEPLRKDVVILDSLTRLPTYHADAHGQGWSGTATATVVPNITTRAQQVASERAIGWVSDGPSIDQYLGQKLGRTVTPRFPVLNLGVQSQWDKKMQVTWLPGGQPVQPENDPYKAYAKLAGSLAGDAPVLDPKATTRLALRKSVLDQVARDLAAFTKRLGAEDRLRAEVQLDAIRTLESRLGAAGGGARAGAACRRPADPTPGIDISKPQAHMPSLQLQLDLLLAAFACDQTRFATLNINTWLFDGANFDPINIKGTQHSMSHDQQEKFVLLRQMHFAEIAKFAQRLQAIPEGAGTMLDNTLIWCCSEISAGHTHRAQAWLTIGGKNLGVNVGKYLMYPAWTPHGQLLVSFLHAMGVQEDRFGHVRGCYGRENDFSFQDIPGGPLPNFLLG